MYHLDIFLLGITQQFCDKAQWRTGLTKFSFENWMLFTATFFVWVHISLGGFDSESVTLALLLTFVAFVMALITVKEKVDFLVTGTLKPQPSHKPVLRIITLWLVGFGLLIFLLLPSSWSILCIWLCIGAWTYFSACIPRLPGKTR